MKRTVQRPDRTEQSMPEHVSGARQFEGEDLCKFEFHQPLATATKILRFRGIMHLMSLLHSSFLRGCRAVTNPFLVYYQRMMVNA